MSAHTHARTHENRSSLRSETDVLHYKQQVSPMQASTEEYSPSRYSQTV